MEGEVCCWSNGEREIRLWEEANRDEQETGSWRDKQEEKGGRFVGAKCMQEEECSDISLARKHLHV